MPPKKIKRRFETLEPRKLLAALIGASDDIGEANATSVPSESRTFELGRVAFAGVAPASVSPINAGLLTRVDTDAINRASHVTDPDIAAGGGPVDPPGTPQVAPVRHLDFDAFAAADTRDHAGGVTGVATIGGHRAIIATVGLTESSDESESTNASLRIVSTNDGRTLFGPVAIDSTDDMHWEDLAVDPQTATVYGLASRVSDERKIYSLHRIDPDTLAHAPLSELDLNDASGVDVVVGGLAIDAEGRAFITTSPRDLPVVVASDDAAVHQIDLDSGSILSSQSIQRDPRFSGRFEGLGFRASTANDDGASSAQLVGSDSSGQSWFVVDTNDGSLERIEIDAPLRGVMGDLSFHTNQSDTNQSDAADDGVRQVYYEDFESGRSGFEIDNSGRSITGLWHRTAGRRFDGLPGHSPLHALYYGAFETAFGDGHYVLTESHRGTVTSPPITLPDQGVNTLSFNYLLDTRVESDHDFVRVRILDGDRTTEIFSRTADGDGPVTPLPQTGTGMWLTAVSDLTSFAGREIRVQFEFDTGAIPRIDPEGWYVDDVLITNTPTPADAIDVSIAKAVDRDRVLPGDTMVYTLNVQNAVTSTGETSPLTVVDTLPAGVTFVSATRVDLPDENVDVGPGSSAGMYDEDSRTITFETEPLAIGSSVQYAITVSVDPFDNPDSGATCDDQLRTLRNVATVSGDGPDPDPANNTAEAVATIVCTDVSVTKSVDDATPDVGQTITFDLDVTNRSPDAAESIAVIDTIPSGLEFVPGSITPQGGVYDAATATVAWLDANVDALSDATFQFSVVVTGDPGTTLTNTVMVDAGPSDVDPNDNTADQDVTINRRDLAIAKTIDNAAPMPGDVVVYTVTVESMASSNAIADGVTVIDVLPAGVNYQTFQATEGTYDPSTSRWTGIDLVPGEIASLELTVSIDANAGGTVVINTATIDGDDGPGASVRTPIGQSVQFIAPLSLYRDGPIVPDAVDRLAVLGRVWFDSDGDGQWDEDENGLDGINVGLFRDDVELSRSQTRGIDLNGDGNIDPRSERGVYTFNNRGQTPPGSYQLRLLDGSDTSVELTLTSESPSIRTEVGIAEIGNFAKTVNPTQNPVEGTAVVIGHGFNDLNINGRWDTDEPGRFGEIYGLFPITDGVVSIIPQYQSVTGQDGRFVFTDVQPGRYELTAFIGSTAGRTITTFIGDEAIVNIDTSPVRTIEVAAGDILIGEFESNQTPNIGVFQFGTVVRPADQFPDRVSPGGASTDEGRLLIESVRKWQSFSVANTTSTTITLTGFDLSNVTGVGSDYLSILRLGENAEVFAADPMFPIEIAAGERVDFLAMYDPAIRSGDTVLFQSPDWLSGTDGSVHTFASDDRVIAQTASGLEFPVHLNGGSTFDSDVSYDRLVDAVDFALIDDALLSSGVIFDDSTAEIGDRFDPTLDINARCPNGSQSALGTCDYAIDGDVRREIALGDFGSLNVELGRSADPIAADESIDRVFAAIAMG